jgi:hypothetical protein
MRKCFVTLLSAVVLAAGVGIPSAETAAASAGRKSAAPRPDGHAVDNAYTAALNALSAQGYVGIADIRMSGKTVAATVQRQDRRVTVSVDPSTGAVREQG